ncbi:MAG: DUF445 domain-containing protein [Alphaproteobacteria bacterium]|nr:DUF445 domain-containing protein [Alphaproteobacteria bacterium]
MHHSTVAPESSDAAEVDLRRMRRLATGLLVVVALAFAAAWWAEPRWPWLAPLRAFAEAAVVGAVADWFAVVALFRHPMGIPLPHTAVITRNQGRIAAAIGRFVAANLVASPDMARRLTELDPAGQAAVWLDRPELREVLARRAVETFPALLATIGEDRLRASVGAALERGLPTVVNPARMAQVLSILTENGQHLRALDFALDEVGGFVARHQKLIRRKVSLRCGEWMPLWIETRVADAVVEGITDTVAELRDPGHPWRLEFERLVNEQIGTLAESAEFAARLETITARVAEDTAVEALLDHVWRDIEDRLTADRAGLAAALERLLDQLGRRLREDESLRQSVNDWCRAAFERHVMPRRATLGRLIADLILRWEASDLTGRAERHMGADLQYIRISGTIVGGLVGLSIHLVTTAIRG